MDVIRDCVSPAVTLRLSFEGGSDARTHDDDSALTGDYRWLEDEIFKYRVLTLLFAVKVAIWVILKIAFYLA
jgi:hypothetical protein